ncbi:hypothetical protein SP19_92 [Salmonella phage 19]|nr:hypothetical protein SP19_92 [Salmonella phage 19]
MYQNKTFSECCAGRQLSGIVCGYPVQHLTHHVKFTIDDLLVLAGKDHLYASASTSDQGKPCMSLIRVVINIAGNRVVVSIAMA